MLHKRKRTGREREEKKETLKSDKMEMDSWTL
jgi:hypothetical protein